MSQDSQHPQKLTQDELKSAIEYLEGILPGNDVQRLPDARHPYELQIDGFVWYKYIDGRWFPAKVIALSAGSRSENKEWWGLLGGPDPHNPLAKWYVVLCPNEGNAIPDNWYTRKLLQVHKKLPKDDAKVERMMNRFKASVDTLGSDNV